MAGPRALRSRRWAPSPSPTLKGGRGGFASWTLCSSRNPAGRAGGWGFLGFGVPGSLRAQQGVSTFRRPRLLPPRRAPRPPPPPPHSPSRAEPRGSRRRARIPREPPPGGAGSRAQALCPCPVRTPPADMQTRRTNEEQGRESGPLRGRRPAARLHASPARAAATPVRASARAPEPP